MREMGFWNRRAICLECSGRFHTRGVGTGRGCQWCGAELIERRARTDAPAGTGDLADLRRLGRQQRLFELAAESS
jgi:hypothetical protein